MDNDVGRIFRAVSSSQLFILRTMANSERTFIAIKPDGVQRNLLGEIIKCFEQKGFRLIAMKLIQVSGLHSSYFCFLGVQGIIVG